MITHEDARLRLSARADGELIDALASELDSHVSVCDECARFAGGILRLSTLSPLLPADAAPPGFESRVVTLVRTGEVAGPRRWRARIGAVAAAAAVAFAIVVAGLPVRTFTITPAAAAEALLRIKTIDVMREIEETTFAGVTTRTRERIRFMAPASVRIDRTDAAGKFLETEIRTPGIRYTTRGGEGILERNNPPDPNPVPEPLSPGIALIGTPQGPGPVVAGRPTIRVAIQDPRVRREALIDAERATLLDSDVSVVLEKGQIGEGQRRVRKRTLSITFNEPLATDTFALPSIRPIDGGFRRRPVSSLGVVPAASPAGFRLVMAGIGRSGDAILYARGAFPILVQIDTEPAGRRIEEVPTTVDGTAATVFLGIYELPVIRFVRDGHTVLISAPATVEGLRRLAEQMFPGLE